MKILYVTDIHGDFDALRLVTQYAKQTKPDLMVVSGDLIDGAFESERHLKLNKGASKFLEKIRKDNKLNMSLEMIANGLLESKEIPEEVKKAADIYKNTIDVSKELMTRQYTELNEILTESKIPFVVLPGNYDGFGLEEVFKEKNIHKKSKRVKDVKISGYGGADYITQMVPLELLTDYVEGQTNQGFISEPYMFFSNEKPQIAVVHNPPKGVLDVIGEGENRALEDHTGKHVGSVGVAQYVIDHKPKIVLSGHVHNDKGVKKIDDTYFINPGRFGRGKDSSGAFYELIVDDKTGELKGYSECKIEDYEKGQLSIRPCNLTRSQSSLERTISEDRREAEAPQAAAPNAPNAINYDAIPYGIVGVLNSIKDYAKRGEKFEKKQRTVSEQKPGWFKKWLGGFSCEDFYHNDAKIAKADIQENNANMVDALFRLNEILLTQQDKLPATNDYRANILGSISYLNNNTAGAVGHISGMADGLKNYLAAGCPQRENI